MTASVRSTASDHESYARSAGQCVRQIIILLGDKSASANIDLVAKRMGTSVRTLQRRLRATGLTYTELAQRARCAEAQRMLKDWRPRIGDIARALGYSDSAHFTRAFQRWTGETPRAFRGRRAVTAKQGPSHD